MPKLVYSINYRKGFTLTELLVVMIIIAILVAIAVPQFVGYSKNANLTALRSDLDLLRKVKNIYEYDKNSLPPTKGSPITISRDTNPTLYDEITKMGLPADGWYELDLTKIKSQDNMIKRIHYGNGKTPDDRFIINQNGNAICYEKGVEGKDGKIYHCVNDKGETVEGNPQTNGTYTYKLEFYDRDNNLVKSETFTTTEELQRFLSPYHMLYSYDQRPLADLLSYFSIFIIGQGNKVFGGYYDENNNFKFDLFKQVKKIYMPTFVDEYLCILDSTGNLAYEGTEVNNVEDFVPHLLYKKTDGSVEVGWEWFNLEKFVQVTSFENIRYIDSDDGFVLLVTRDNKIYYYDRNSSQWYQLDLNGYNVPFDSAKSYFINITNDDRYTFYVLTQDKTLYAFAFDPSTNKIIKQNQIENVINYWWYGLGISYTTTDGKTYNYIASTSESQLEPDQPTEVFGTIILKQVKNNNETIIDQSTIIKREYKEF